MVGWQGLPPEIRLMIVEEILEAIRQCPSRTFFCLQLALVSREWHGYFEHENFRTVHLSQQRLDGFEELVSNNEQRRPFVERIKLHVKLPEYGCDICHLPITPAERKTNDELVTKTLEKFMKIMSTWEKLPNKSVTLELGAYSPSDKRHMYMEDLLRLEWSRGSLNSVYWVYNAMTIREAHRSAGSPKIWKGNCMIHPRDLWLCRSNSHVRLPVIRPAEPGDDVEKSSLAKAPVFDRLVVLDKPDGFRCLGMPIYNEVLAALPGVHFFLFPEM